MSRRMMAIIALITILALVSLYILFIPKIYSGINNYSTPQSTQGQ